MSLDTVPTTRPLQQTNLNYVQCRTMSRTAVDHPVKAVKQHRT